MSSDITVQLEFTPNPDTLKYATNRTFLPSGAANFSTVAAAKGRSPLAESLFEDARITAVMIGTTFVTVTVKDQNSLAELNDSVMKRIRTHLESGAPAVTAQAPASKENLSEIEKRICEILDQEVRPAVAMDGGDISFEKYEDGFVFLKMQGSCAGCPSSMMTLKMGVESRLKAAIPEIQEVIPV